MPAGKPESARGVGSLGSGRPSSSSRAGKASGSPSFSGLKRLVKLQDGKTRGSLTGGNYGDLPVGRKIAATTRRNNATINRMAKATNNRDLSKARSTARAQSKTFIKPSAAGKKAVAKYSGKMKNTPKG